MSAAAITRSAATAVLVFALAAASWAGPMDLSEGRLLGEGPDDRAIQETIWFQGYIADAVSGDPVEATYTVTVRLYDQAAGGTSLWGPESHVGTVISAGWFNIELGSITGGLPAFDDPPYYLQVMVDGETLSPRLKLASSPMAFHAAGTDAGLALPYSGSYGGGGAAFQLYQTGGGICGHFIINDAGSSAAAVYGSHSGTGAAVMGWHTGNGVAIKGVANGTGDAGYFDGRVVATDTITAPWVEGDVLFSEHIVVTPGTLLVGTFMLPDYPEPGFPLVCQDDMWGRGQWAPINVIDVDNETGAESIGSGTGNQYGSCQVTLAVPNAGYIMVTATVHISLDHAGTDEVLIGVSTSSSDWDGGATFSQTHLEFPSGWDWYYPLDWTVTTHRTIQVSEGTHTYYLMGEMLNGYDPEDRFQNAHMTAIYYPYQLVREDAGGGGGVRAKVLELLRG